MITPNTNDFKDTSAYNSEYEPKKGGVD